MFAIADAARHYGEIKSKRSLRNRVSAARGHDSTGGSISDWADVGRGPNPRWRPKRREGGSV